MRISAYMVVSAALAGCTATPAPQLTAQPKANVAQWLLRESRDAYEAQVRMNVEAILAGMAAARGTRVEATAPAQRLVLPE